MSRQPIDLSPDLQKLQNEGYNIDVQAGYLLIREVPYVNGNRELKEGILISQLELSNNRTNKPTDHTTFWIGEHPCHSNGSIITAIQNGAVDVTIVDDIKASFRFSAKADYRDYHHKMTTYIGRITGEAQKLDNNVTACTFPTIMAENDTSNFNYIDTASSRAGIVNINNRIANQKIGIVGLGGTGSYILDLVAKNNVSEIRIIDGDVFSQHNIFRSPGAPSQDELVEKPSKADYFDSLYSKLHKGIISHNVYLDETNINLIDGLDFVFICIDRGDIKSMIVEHLVSQDIPFVEVGMGVNIVDDKLMGIVRTTISTSQTRELAAPHISYSDDNGTNEYVTNIQIAELNSLNACIAVIKWKKFFEIYQDARIPINTSYSICSGEIAQESIK